MVLAGAGKANAGATRPDDLNVAFSVDCDPIAGDTSDMAVQTARMMEMTGIDPGKTPSSLGPASRLEASGETPCDLSLGFSTSQVSESCVFPG